MRNISAEHEARRAGILVELQALAASIGTFQPAREPQVAIQQHAGPRLSPGDELEASLPGAAERRIPALTETRRQRRHRRVVVAKGSLKLASCSDFAYLSLGLCNLTSAIPSGSLHSQRTFSDGVSYTNTYKCHPISQPPYFTLNPDSLEARSRSNFFAQLFVLRR